MKNAMALLVVCLGITAPSFAQKTDAEIHSEILKEKSQLDLKNEEVHTPKFLLLEQENRAPATWQGIATDIEGKEVQVILDDAGWSDAVVSPAITASGQYDLYRKTLAPGVLTYLVVPAEGGDPVQFGGTITEAGWLDGAPDLAEIQAQIIAQLGAAIEALCNMPARPTTITASASALGVISVEGTWDADKVCIMRPE